MSDMSAAPLVGGLPPEQAKPVVKHIPADFLVRENLTVRLAPSGGASQCYLLLRKQGYTTPEAIGLVARGLGVSRETVTYAGRKDEDGITEQLIALPAAAIRDDGPGCGPGHVLWRRSEPGRLLELAHYGYGNEPLRIGELEGNSFRVVVRGLSQEQAERLAATDRTQIFFLNYYDTQRFGVPGGVKRTHLVGEALLARDWPRALRQLAELGAPESQAATTWSGLAEDFFAALDPRTVSFYLAAHGSYAWNAGLCDEVTRTCPGDCYGVSLDGLDYVYLTSGHAALRVLTALPEAAQQRHDYQNGAFSEHTSMRPTVVQTRLRVTAPERDEVMAGGFCLSVTFALPSGCYATAGLRQWLGYAGLTPRRPTEHTTGFNAGVSAPHRE